MAASSYSERFMVAGGGGVITTYTVPPGYRAVLKAIAAANENGTAGNFWVYVNLVPVYFFLFPAETRGVNVETRLVYYGGEQMRCYTSSANLHVVLSGYLFRDDGQLRAAPGDVERYRVPDPQPPPGDAPRPPMELAEQLEASSAPPELVRECNRLVLV